MKLWMLTSALSLVGRSAKSFQSTTVSRRLCLAMSAVPPVPRREEDRVVFAGAAPEGWDANVPRQSQESKEKLMDPPVPIPDPYGWMRTDKRDNQEVLDHLKAENEFTKASIEHLEPLQEKLYKEFLSSIQETDYTTPRPRKDYWYYTRTFEGKSYRQYCRAPKASDSFQVDWDGKQESPILPGEEAYLDVNVLGKDKPYCSLGAVKVSPSQKYLAYSVDFKVRIIRCFVALFRCPVSYISYTFSLARSRVMKNIKSTSEIWLQEQIIL